MKQRERGTALSVNTTLTGAQAKFALLLESAPYLMHLWDFDRREFDSDLVDRFLGRASHGQCIMAKFFLAVWLGENRYSFDAIEATAALDKNELSIITEWMLNPFWP